MQDRYWKAVLSRDAASDGVFVYAVRSTGVYCRPTCPSRRPRREQVVFFPAPDDAERAGFRPCRRCRPRRPASALVERLCRYIEAHRDEPLTLGSLGVQASLSPHHLQRVFRRAVGVSPRQYADALRLASLKTSLREGHDVTTALYDAGYGSSSRLYERAPGRLGMTPATYRRGGQGMRIGYAIVPCPLGRLLVAATPRGISALSLGDADAALIAALKQEYPNAEIRPERNGLGRRIDAILKYLEGRRTDLSLPVDVQATAFQQRVWEELRRIPYGSTRTYSQVAQSLGRPAATRAVARACATNPVSLVIPCHRVVREDGGLGGYRWGLERKRALLDQERRRG